jgi:drug/metabolite transporter (DMT)-like permease
VSLVIGLLVALSFGSADFLGGLASRSTRTLVVVVVGQSCALVLAVLVALAAGGSPGPGDLLLGAVGGALNVTALACLFRGFAVGRIGVVAPVAAIIGATIPVIWGLARGERPSAVALVGVALAIVAGGLISREHDAGGPESGRHALVYAVAAGFGFGFSFICYGLTSDGSGFWPVLTGRAAAVVGVALVLAVTRTRISFPRPIPRRQAIGSGVFDVTGGTLLLVAIRAGLFTTTAPIASLAPGFTVGFAWWFLHERASRLQVIGLATALVGLVLIAAG